MRYKIRLASSKDVAELSKLLGHIDDKKMIENVELLKGNELWIWVKDK